VLVNIFRHKGRSKASWAIWWERREKHPRPSVFSGYKWWDRFYLCGFTQ